MAVVTLAPILSDPVDQSRQSAIEINPFVFPKGNFVYEILVDSNTNKIKVQQSNYDGTGTTELDSANAPSLASSSLICYSDPSSAIIHIAYQTTGTNKVAIITINTTTKLYSSIITSTFTGTTAFGHGIGLFYRPGSGLYYVSYADASTLNYITIDGAGVTSAPVIGPTTESVGQGLFYTKFDETSGIAFWFHLQSTGTQRFNCTTLSALDVIGTPVNITTDGIEWAEAVISGTRLDVAWINQNSTKVNTTGCTIATAPVFDAVANLNTVVAPTAVTYISITYDWLNQLSVFWCYTNLSAPPGVDEIHFSQFISAAWTAPAVFYDAVANPPSGALPYPGNFVHTLQVVKTIHNSWFAVTAMETGTCAGFILVAPGIAPNPPPTPGLAPTKCPLNFDDSSGNVAIACPVFGSPATVGVLYSNQMVVTGATAPLSFLITVGSLPTGLTLNAVTGFITGTPTVLGTFNFTIQVIDANANSNFVSCSITIIGDILLSVTCPLSGAANFGAPYTGTFIGTGGTGPYTFAIFSGALPAGLTLTGDTVSGTPTETGTFNYTVRVKDSLAATADSPCQIIVGPPLPPSPPPLP